MNIIAKKCCGLLGVAAFAGMANAGEVFADDFSDGSVWPKRKNVTPGKLSVNFGAEHNGSKCLLLHGTNEKRLDTAWLVRTGDRPLPAGNRSWRLEFEAAADSEMAPGGREGEEWYSGVAWIGADGKTVRFDTVVYIIGDSGEFAKVVRGGDIPKDAVAFAVQFGFDWPNIFAGHKMAFRNVKLSVSEQLLPVPPIGPRPDSQPPSVSLATATPLADPAAEVEFLIEDPSGVDWKSLSVAIGDKDVSADCRRKGACVSYRPPQPWTTGVHTAKVTVADSLGHRIEAERYFANFEPPKSPKFSLRDDGMTLVDGKAYFPIGMYSVVKCDFNSNSFHKAFADLREAGMNFAQAYGCPQPDFLDAAASNNCLVMVRPWEHDGKFYDYRRNHPAIIGWYLADDTCRHFKPEQLARLDSYIRATDPNHLTTQADEIAPYSPVSNYIDYVPYTDVFLPEIYPLRNNRKQSERTCVGEVIFDMKRSCRDARLANRGRKTAVWAILQHFSTSKQCWNRYPTARELKAMTFAAVCNGASGITYYTYRLRSNPEKNDINFAAVSTPETWASLTNTTRLLKSIYEPLTAVSEKPPKVKIISGALKDPLGNDSISVIAKKWNGEYWLIAVNSSPDPVKVRFDTGCGSYGNVEVWKESRSLKLERGVLEDIFEGFDVHIYRCR